MAQCASPQLSVFALIDLTNVSNHNIRWDPLGMITSRDSLARATVQHNCA